MDYTATQRRLLDALAEAARAAGDGNPDRQREYDARYEECVRAGLKRHRPRTGR
jgi:hypothetical protein